MELTTDRQVIIIKFRFKVINRSSFSKIFEESSIACVQLLLTPPPPPENRKRKGCSQARVQKHCTSIHKNYALEIQSLVTVMIVWRPLTPDVILMYMYSGWG
jgi:hypothetical protein